MVCRGESHPALSVCWHLSLSCRIWLVLALSYVAVAVVVVVVVAVVIVVVVVVAVVSLWRCFVWNLCAFSNEEQMLPSRYLSLRRSIPSLNSKRSVRLRYNEHLRDAKNNTKNTPFGEHFKQCHPDANTDHSSLTISILQVCKDVAELKIAESIEIRNHKPSLNIMNSSWSLIKPVPYSEI